MGLVVFLELVVSWGAYLWYQCRIWLPEPERRPLRDSCVSTPPPVAKMAPKVSAVFSGHSALWLPDAWLPTSVCFQEYIHPLPIPAFVPLLWSTSLAKNVLSSFPPNLGHPESSVPILVPKEPFPEWANPLVSFCSELQGIYCTCHTTQLFVTLSRVPEPVLVG